MLFLTVCFCWVVCAYAAPVLPDVVPLEKQQPTVIPIVSQSEEFEPNGSYKFSYETGNGIKREESSYTKLVPKAQSRSADDSNEGRENDSDSEEIHVQVGSYSYTAPDGTLISVRYIADENGFQPILNIPGLPNSVVSSEKSGRALNAEDNAEAGSAPAAKSAPQLESRISPVNDDKANANVAKKQNDSVMTTSEPTTEVTITAKEESSSTSKSVTTEVAKSDATTENTETTKGNSDSSTTEGHSDSSTTEGHSDLSTTEGTVKTTSVPNTTENSSSEVSTTEGKNESSTTTEVVTKEVPTTLSAITSEP